MEEKDELEVKTGFGSVKAGGSAVVIVVAVVCAAGVVAFMLRDHDLRAAEQIQDTRKHITDLKEAVHEQTYINTLNEQQKRDLRLEMPESLRKKVGR
jgi:hypothetical protein